MKTKIEIKTFGGKLLFEYESENNSIKKTLVEAVSRGADLRGADLRGAYLQGAYLQGAYLRGAYLQGAYLQGAYLRGADLQGAYLRGADLQGAYLRGAYLRGAYLRGAYLRGAYLQGAYLRGAYLQGAYLQGADLQGADLRGADLQGADLRGADLQGAYLRGAYLRGAYLQGADLQGAKDIPERYWNMCRDDFWAVLSAAPQEVKGLRNAIIEGKINGSNYEGDCACLVGTIANVRGCHYEKLGILKPDSSRPIEQFFTQIKPKDTPENNEFSKKALDWLDQWVNNVSCLTEAK